jgi:hypothetical protein
VREIKADLPTRDGQYDTTHLFGPRVISMDGSFISGPQGSRQKAVDSLMPFLAASARPTLTVAVDDDTPARTYTLRPSAMTGPHVSPNYTGFTVSWVAPDPTAYSTVSQNVVIQLGVVAGGRTYPLVFPRTYVLTAPGGYAVAVNNGSYQTWPVFDVHGACTNPVITYSPPATGKIVTVGMTVAAGDFVRFDTRTMTVLYNNQAGASRYYQLDFAQTVWQPFPPGSTGIHFSAASSDTNAYLQATWSDAYLA